MLQMIAGDPAVPKDIAEEATQLLDMGSQDLPATMKRRIDRWSQRIIGQILPHLPTEDYVRCISYDALFDYYILNSVQQHYRTSIEYLEALLERSADPASIIWDDLQRPILVPARHSWLIPASDVNSNDVEAIRAQLQIQGNPPFLVMEFSRTRMVECGLYVRQPCSIDAIRTSQLQWTPGGVPNERIDGDIPFVALGSLRWIA